jgi:SAM-dependent methyltransferase
MTDTGPLFVSSGDLIADRRYKWALDHAARGDFRRRRYSGADRGAGARLRHGLVRARRHPRPARRPRRRRRRVRKSPRCRSRRIITAPGCSSPGSDAGDATPAMSETYVRRLFDQYAARYDAALTERSSIAGRRSCARPSNRRCSGQDGRCASLPRSISAAAPALGGAAFRPFADRLIGVDLSPAMAAQAAAKGHLRPSRHRRSYADFPCHRGPQRREISPRARRRCFRLCERSWSPVLAAVARVLAHGGFFAFTVETHSGGGVKLLPTLRYAHGEAHIRHAIEASGLALGHTAEAAVRNEKGVPVDSLVVVAQPSTAKRQPASSGG